MFPHPGEEIIVLGMISQCFRVFQAFGVMSLRCLRFCIAFEALGKRHFNSTEICTVLNSLIGQSDEQLSTQAFCQGPGAKMGSAAKRLRVEHASHILTRTLAEHGRNSDSFSRFTQPRSCFLASAASLPPCLIFLLFEPLWSFQPLWCLWRLVS